MPIVRGRRGREAAPARTIDPRALERAQAALNRIQHQQRLADQFIAREAQRVVDLEANPPTPAAQEPPTIRWPAFDPEPETEAPPRITTRREPGDVSSMTIGEYAAHPPRNKTGDGPGRLVGIEVEVEGVGEPVTEAGRAWVEGWNIKEDRSLRNNGAEFVTTPTRTREVRPSLSRFYSTWGRQWDAHARCGTHVHVDVRDFTFSQLLSLAAAYTLIEPLFYQFVGQDREENIYCIPWYRAPNEVKHAAAINKPMSFGRFQNFCKYTGCYFGPAANFGTVEFRMAPSYGPSLQDKFTAWVEGLSYFVTTCRTLTLEEVFGIANEGNGIVNLARRLLPESFLLYTDLSLLQSQVDHNGCVELASEFRKSTVAVEREKPTKEIGWKVQKSPTLRQPKLLRVDSNLDWAERLAATDPNLEPVRSVDEDLDDDYFEREEIA